MIPTMWLFGKGTAMETAKDQWLLGVVEDEGKMNRWSTEDFYGSETILCDNIMMTICHYIFSKPIKCTPTRVNS